MHCRALQLALSKAHRPEQKSDTYDALELCEGLRRGFYRSMVHVPSPAIGDLRTMLSRRRHFIRIQTAEVNAVKRLLRGSPAIVGDVAACTRLLTANACSPARPSPQNSKNVL